MANPRRKNSKSRTAKRRAQYKVKRLPRLTTCSNCDNPHLLHRACPSCGQYRGRQIVTVAEQ